MCFKHKVLIQLFLLYSYLCFSQKEATVWHFGTDGQGLDFANNNPATFNFNLTRYHNEGWASICDKNTGALLFYSDGQYVWDKNNELMPNGINLSSSASSAQAALIVPNPANKKQYYLFSVDNFNSPAGNFKYSIVDMSLRNGLGDIVATKRGITIISGVTERLAGTIHCNGKDYWIIVHLRNSDKFYAYQLTASGISSSPRISAIGLTYPASSSAGSYSVGQIKISPNGKKIVSTTFQNGVAAELFSFNNTTGDISSLIRLTKKTTNDFSYGASFSPDNTKLYVSAWPKNTGSWPNPKDSLFQYDVSVMDETTVNTSKTLVGTINNVLLGMQIGPDGKIYIANNFLTNGKMSLSVINNPNASALACNFTANQIIFNYGGGTLNQGLSYYMDYLFNESTSNNNEIVDFNSDSIVCIGAEVQFTDASSPTPLWWEWDFGDENISSTVQNPVYTYSSSGTYSVTLTINQNCTNKSIFKQIVVQQASVDAGEDIYFRTGDVVSLNASGAISYSWHPTVGLSDSSIYNPTLSPTENTVYYVVGRNEIGCTDTDTINLFLIPSETFFIANSFTPNEDGINDEFIVKGVTLGKMMELSIYNRFGEMIYYSKNNNIKWDGKVKNKDVSVGEYPYRLKVYNADNVQYKEQIGVINLIR